MKKFISTLLSLTLCITTFSFRASAIGETTVIASEYTYATNSIGANVTAATSGMYELPVNTFPTTAAVDEIIKAEQPLIDTYQSMIENFTTSDGEIDYPSAYGGAYIENGILNVNVKENSPIPCTMDVKSVVFHEVVFSYNELQELSDNVLLLNVTYITSVGLGDRDNKIHVGINKNNYNNSDDILNNIESNLKKMVYEKLEEYPESIETWYDLPIECFWEEPIIPSATDIQGGMGITVNSNSNSSIAICGNYYGDSASGERAVLTSGHYRDIDDTVTLSGKSLGKIVVSNCMGGEYYDYGIIKITNKTGFNSTNQVLNDANYTTITDIARKFPSGTTVCKYGRNGFAIGVIGDTNKTVFYGDYGYIFGLVQVEIEPAYIGKCGGGDSGGCIYRGHDFYGIYDCDDRNPTSAKNATEFHFTPATGIRNFSIQTN